MIRDQDFREFHYNVLGAKSKFVGDLSLCGDAIITSEVHGSIEIRDEGKLILERDSFVKGKIRAINLDIFGTVEGDIECLGLLSIRSSAHVTGKIKSGKLVIYPGAVVETTVESEGI
jgi:cytoskeletal protein CcmA (bactofilin family)